MEELMKLISNVGFPIAVAAYLLVRTEKKLDVLTDSISKLTTAVDKLNEKIDNSKKVA